ncbi:calmodulin-like protein 7 [Hevea brasiliensis]|uniref:calmodulin-like protein 7 n=1 Tax=Hevea brasiliensis TaxID=3981 RepID=UPI0025FA06FA|nr:calmodulin-like protein 7 [Hevea brasiliensis]
MRRQNIHLRTCPGVLLNEAQVKGMLLRADSNGDGILSWQELKEGFKSLGAKVPRFRASMAFNIADENGDGCIDEKELEKVVKYASGLGYTIR